ncbi:hypothetical protein KXW59_003381 [Aspergillus fumigatus]|nr:hypothetical protein KXW59_003381 [Aspergillus fumigatus]
MSFLSGLCGCFAPKSPPRAPSARALSRAMAETHQHHHYHNDSNFTSHHRPDEGPVYMAFDEDGYTPPVPLPRYTPRPMSSIQEKTLEAHMRDPPVSSPPPPPMAHIAQPRPVLRRECLPRDLAGHSR